MTLRSHLTIAAFAGAGLAACSSADDGCDYAERMDTTNNSNVGGTPEDTAVVLGTAPITICAEANTGHDDTEDLDYDAFVITAGATGAATLTLTATDPPALSLFDVSVLQNDTLRGDARLTAPATVQLTPGAARLVVRVQNPAPIAASFAYRITLAAAAR
jgi:hypothetical protein